MSTVILLMDVRFLKRFRGLQVVTSPMNACILELERSVRVVVAFLMLHFVVFLLMVVRFRACFLRCFWRHLQVVLFPPAVILLMVARSLVCFWGLPTIVIVYFLMKVAGAILMLRFVLFPPIAILLVVARFLKSFWYLLEVVSSLRVARMRLLMFVGIARVMGAFLMLRLARMIVSILLFRPAKDVGAILCFVSLLRDVLLSLMLRFVRMVVGILLKRSA